MLGVLLLAISFVYQRDWLGSPAGKILKKAPPAHEVHHSLRARSVRALPRHLIAACGPGPGNFLFHQRA